jgi:hypothetical protein
MRDGACRDVQSRRFEKIPVADVNVKQRLYIFEQRGVIRTGSLKKGEPPSRIAFQRSVINFFNPRPPIRTHDNLPWGANTARY